MTDKQTTIDEVSEDYVAKREVLVIECLEQLVEADWLGKNTVSLTKGFLGPVVSYVHRLEEIIDILMEDAVEVVTPVPEAPSKANDRAVKAYRGKQRELVVGDRVIFEDKVNDDGSLKDDTCVYIIKEAEVYGGEAMIKIALIDEQNSTISLNPYWDEAECFVLLKLSDFAKFPYAVQPGDVFANAHDKTEKHVVVDRYTGDDRAVDEIVWNVKYIAAANKNQYADGMILAEDMNDVYHIVDTPQ